MIDEKKEEKPLSQEEAQKRYLEMVKADVEKYLNHLQNKPPEEVVGELAKEIVHLKHNLNMINSHLNQAMNAIGFLMQDHQVKKEEKSPVSTTKIDNKDIILEKDDDEDESK